MNGRIKGSTSSGELEVGATSGLTLCKSGKLTNDLGLFLFEKGHYSNATLWGLFYNAGAVHGRIFDTSSNFY